MNQVYGIRDVSVRLHACEILDITQSDKHNEDKQNEDLWGNPCSDFNWKDVPNSWECRFLRRYMRTVEMQKRTTGSHCRRGLLSPASAPKEAVTELPL